MIPKAVGRLVLLAVLLLFPWAALASAQGPRSGDDLSPLVHMLRDLGRDDSVKGPLMKLLGLDITADLYPGRLIEVTLSEQPQRNKLLCIPRPEGEIPEVFLGAVEAPNATFYRTTARGELKAALSVPRTGEPRVLRNEDAMEGFRREARWWLEREPALRGALGQPNPDAGELCQTGENRFAPCAQ